MRDFEQNQNNPGAGGFQGGPFGGGQSHFHYSSGGGGGFGANINLEDILGGMFGGFGGETGGGRRKKQRSNAGGHGFGGFQETEQKKSISFKDSEVIIVTDDLTNEIEQRRRLVLGIFYSPHALNDEEVENLKAFAKKYKSIMTVIAMNCEKNKPICKTFDIKSLPIIRIYPEDKSQEPSDFRGQINVPNLERVTIEKMENHIIKVGQRNYQALRDRALSENKHIFILYPTKRSSSPLFMSLSTVGLDLTASCSNNLFYCSKKT